METRCSRPSFAWLYESNEPQRFGEMRAYVNTPLPHADSASTI